MKKDEQRLALLITHEPSRGYGLSRDGIDLHIQVVRVSDAADKDRFPFICCDEYATRLYRDVGLVSYLTPGQEPYSVSAHDLQARDVFRASVDQMKRRIAAIEHIQRAMLRIEHAQGATGALSEFVARLALVLKTESVFVSNKTRALAYPRALAFRDGDYTTYSPRDAHDFLAQLARVATSGVADAAE